METNSYRLRDVTELDASGLAAQVLGEIALKTEKIFQGDCLSGKCSCDDYGCSCDFDSCPCEGNCDFYCGD